MSKANMKRTRLKQARSMMLSLSIGNAQEFAPHPGLSVLMPFDVLFVNEDNSFAPGTHSLNQKYHVFNKVGELMFKVIDTMGELKPFNHKC